MVLEEMMHLGVVRPLFSFSAYKTFINIMVLRQVPFSTRLAKKQGLEKYGDTATKLTFIKQFVAEKYVHKAYGIQLQQVEYRLYVLQSLLKSSIC